jgi:hypothetical protein
MRRISIPNNISPNEFGVELDKDLTDGSKALGIIRVTDSPSPFKPDEILITIEAWQVDTNGRPIVIQNLSGRAPQRVGIRPLVVAVPRGEYTHEVADKQINIAAAALALEAKDIPEPVSLPNLPQDVAPTAVPEQLPTT